MHTKCFSNESNIFNCSIDKLIKKQKGPTEPLVYFITIEETYDVIKQARVATGHEGRDRMKKQLESKFANVYRDSMELFKSFCYVCQEKTIVYVKEQADTDYEHE